MPVAGSGDSFGYKYLRNKGWKSGNGLGKNQQGQAEAIKVKLKRDTAGVGHDLSEQFTNQWWNHVFNKAAAKVSIEAADGEVKVKSQKLSEDKKTKLKEKTLYGNFVKGSTLVGGMEAREDNSDSEPEDCDSKVPKFTKLTDEELFEACGGRTAHKGARHGLKLNGKLSRVEEQEVQVNTEDLEPVKPKSKKSKKRKVDRADDIEQHKVCRQSPDTKAPSTNDSNPANAQLKRKTKSNKSTKKQKVERNAEPPSNGDKTLVQQVDSSPSKTKAKRKKKRRKLVQADQS